MRYVRTDTYKIYDDLRCTRAVLLSIDSYWLCANISITHTYSSEVPVWHTPVEVAEVRFSMTYSVVHGQGKRGNVHIPAIMSVGFLDVVFDGLRLFVE